jgi:hypothetical protein
MLLRDRSGHHAGSTMAMTSTGIGYWGPKAIQTPLILDPVRILSVESVNLFTASEWWA